MKEEEFYIGWQEEAPEGFRKTGRYFFLTVVLLLLGFILFFSKAEIGFIDSYFQYGDLTELKGQLVTEPIPAILIEESGERKTIPLVGFGKFGAGPVLEGLKAQLGEDISQHEVVIRGTIFSYQDKKWMELTEGLESLVSHQVKGAVAREITQSGPISISGEIVDPKCFFGVMNPGTKAVHRSCARRCISGGIVPVLAIREEGRFVDYYLLEDDNSENFNQEILPYVGLPITISGEVTQYDDWKVLSISNKSLGNVEYGVDPTIAMCLNQ